MNVQQISLEKVSDILDKATENQQVTYPDVVIHKGSSPELGDYTLVNTAEGNTYLIQ